MGETIFARDGKKFTDTACPTQGPWFGKCMKSYNLEMRFIKKHGFVVTSDVAKSLLVGWDI